MPDAPRETEKQAAIAFVLAKTNLPQDVVSAQIYRDGPAIVIKHNKAMQVCIHTTFMDAAVAAVEWVQQNAPKTDLVTAMNRKQRRRFDVGSRKTLRKRLR